MPATRASAQADETARAVPGRRMGGWARCRTLDWRRHRRQTHGTVPQETGKDWSTTMPQVTLTVNGRAWTGEVPTGATLLELLRERVGLTGAKQGCGEGQCASCTVLVDGRP